METNILVFVFRQYVKTPPMPIPSDTPKVAYGKIEMKLVSKH